MNVGERAIEVAERNSTLERDAAVARIRAGLDGDGSAFCVDCDAEIGEARRAALPSAKRCVGCQSFVERRG